MHANYSYKVEKIRIYNAKLDKKALACICKFADVSKTVQEEDNNEL